MSSKITSLTKYQVFFIVSITCQERRKVFFFNWVLLHAKLTSHDNQCCIQDCFEPVGNLFSLVGSWDATMVGTKVKVLKSCLSGLVKIAFLGVFLVHFLHVIHAFFLLSSQLFSCLLTLYPIKPLFSRGRKSYFGISWLGQEKTS